jgi:hypothetical protein
VTNATARTRDVTVDLDHDALALSYDYRVPPDVRLEFPPLPRTAPLRVRVASGGAAFRTVLNGQGVTLPLAVRADGVGFDPSVGRLDARVRVGPDGPWTIRLRVRDVEDRIVAERVLDLPSRSTRAVGGLVDAPGVYRVRVTARARERAADASGARVDERTVAVVARGRRVLDVDAGGGVRVRVDR